MPYKVASGRTLFASKNYQAKVLDMFGSSIVAYWPQNEAGGTVSRDVGGRGFNGAYTGVTLRAQGIGDGETAASYDGSTSYNNVYSAGLASAFNGQEGTLSVWAQVASAGVWTDATARSICALRVDGNNYVQILKTSTNNTCQFIYDAGATVKQNIFTSQGGKTVYFNVAVAWNKASDFVRAYANGIQIGSTLTGLGTWVGSLSATQCVIGATTSTPTNVWSGSIGPVFLLNRAATAGEIAAASTL